MAAPGLQEILIGGFAYFLEAGTTVNAQVISPLIKPANTPATNWTDGTLGDIQDFKFQTDKIEDSYLRTAASGGYEKINRMYTTQDFLTLKTRQMNEMVWRLQHGLGAKINEATAQAPGTSIDRKVEGWLRLQGRQLGGYDRFTMDWWCEMRLEGENNFQEKVVMPSLRFTLIRSLNGVLIAGNTMNFPVPT